MFWAGVWSLCSWSLALVQPVGDCCIDVTWRAPAAATFLSPKLLHAYAYVHGTACGTAHILSDVDLSCRRPSKTRWMSSPWYIGAWPDISYGRDRQSRTALVDGMVACSWRDLTIFCRPNSSHILTTLCNCTIRRVMTVSACKSTKVTATVLLLPIIDQSYNV